jgi:ferredoxin
MATPTSADHVLTATPAAGLVVPPAELDTLIQYLREQGYHVLGPTVRDAAIVCDEVTTLADLPRGWVDDQQPGRYRLEQHNHDRLFDYVVGPSSWKRTLYPPRTTLVQARRVEGTIALEDVSPPVTRYAFLGVRPCELAAIAVQDRIFLEGPWVDPVYQANRDDNFLVAVNCAVVGGTCFCVSMQTGPRAQTGYDLALTELPDGALLVEVGSEKGERAIGHLTGRRATEADLAQAQAISEAAARQMGRTLPTDGLQALLYANYDHPQWERVAQRCLSCGNCTLVCPTCFCTTMEDTTDLTGAMAERIRSWDTCFGNDFSYIHGGAVRTNTRARYRQWLTHKLATWVDQFGSFGCVGCGRCITWCPVGIDITEEVAAIRHQPL